jgi:uncharacterized protein (DUF433 family)
MKLQYVEQRDQGYWVAGSRVSLESIIFAFREGLSPETIAAECFPTLSLEQVYGTITYYLSHRPEIDAYLRDAEDEFTAFQQVPRDPEFSQKMPRDRWEM